MVRSYPVRMSTDNMPERMLCKHKLVMVQMTLGLEKISAKTSFLSPLASMSASISQNCSSFSSFAGNKSKSSMSASSTSDGNVTDFSESELHMEITSSAALCSSEHTDGRLTVDSASDEQTETYLHIDEVNSCGQKQ